MSSAELETRIARLEAAVRILGRGLTVTDATGALVWPFPEFDAVGDEQRASWQEEDDRRRLRNAESTRQRLASRGRSLEAFEEKCAVARKRLAERGRPDLLD